jgi:hypothetical protein
MSWLIINKAEDEFTSGIVVCGISVKLGRCAARLRNISM